MNNLIDIKSIQTDVSLSVIDSIINLIDKNELISEYSEDEVMNDIIMESMIVFMESFSKDKDEITKWMYKKGYFYNGDNPKKKKEFNRMYQFLKQHKFDPKTETYESDIKMKDGKNERIKINIDPDISNEDKDFYLKNKDKEKDLSIDNLKRLYRIEDMIDIINDTNKGKNAFYYPANNSINLGARKLKNKQFDSQITLKHEEGHAESHKYGKNGISKNRNLSEDSPAIKALKEHKAAGKYVNSHDDSTEELMADLYAVINGKIRTKNWGKNKTTRKINIVDLVRKFNKVSDLETLIRNAIEEYETDKQTLKKRINETVESFFEENDYKKIKKEMVDNSKVYIVNNLCYNVMNSISDSLTKFSCKYKTGFVNDKFSNKSDEISNMIHTSLNKTNNTRNIAEMKKEIDLYRKLLNNIIDVYKKYGIHDPSDVKKILIKEKHFNDEEDLILSMLLDYSKNMAEVIDIFNADIADFNKSISRSVMSIKNQHNSDKDIVVIEKLVRNMIETYVNTGENPGNNFNERLYTVIMKMFKDNEKDAKDKDKLTKKLRESYELRIKFASIAVNEYFSEMIDGYYYD